MNTDEFVIHRAKRTNSGYILLCHLPGNEITPWVTWYSEDITGTRRINGNYFYAGEATDAFKDFEDR